MKNLWNQREAGRLKGIDLLVYRSRLIGRETSLVLQGGGNTSLKHQETDFRGRSIRVMRIKGSGADLRTIAPGRFPGIRLDDIEPLFERADMADEEMVDYLLHCLVDPDSPRPSIETLLHGFVPHPHVDHTHADAILALTNTIDGKRNVEAAFGSDAVWIPYRRPGFRLSREVGEAARRNPSARCAVLEKHGLITWGDTARRSYDTTIEMINRAEKFAREQARGRVVLGGPARQALAGTARRRVATRIAPYLRGLLARCGGGAPARAILHFDDSSGVLEFVGSEAGPQAALAGPATPDHLLYTRVRPLVVQLPPAADPGAGEAGAGVLKAALEKGVGKYVDWYGVYFRKNAPAGTAKLDPTPRVILIPGIGMFTAGRDAGRAALVAEIYRHGIQVMRAAYGISEYRSLSVKDAFNVEYWPMELYRMNLAAPEGPLARRVALISGAAGGIGRAIAERLADAGCHVVVTDRDRDGVLGLAREIEQRHGAGRALGTKMDVTSETSVARAFEAAVMTYGGIDIIVSNAGIAHCCPIDRMERADWERSFDVNATGHFLVARQAVRILKDQGIGGSLIFISSKNVLAPGKDFGAYSASKAAETQLARVLAIETGPFGIRVNTINPDAVFEGSRLWSDEMRSERARAHGIRPDELEAFYQRRNLLGVKVTADDVAEAAIWLASDRSAKTTGCIITTDGGVREAFPR
jgi:rhamnulose-1-phosphate aldolase/alcohol dehydrogenase